MFRYFAFFWNESDPVARGVAERLMRKCQAPSAAWTPLVFEPGIAVLVAGAASAQGGRVLMSHDGRLMGVVLGDLFRASFDQAGRLTADETDRIVRSNGKELVSSYWGNYVAFLREPFSHRVLRAPAGALPCFRIALDGVVVYFSSTESCAALEEFTFSIDWPRVARSLVAPLSSTHTELREIREVMPGWCEETTTLSREGPNNASAQQYVATVAQRYWDPIEIARTDTVRDFHDAARALHDTTVHCVRAWAEGRPRILHALSGGLDSSIVLGCLASAPSRPEVTCFTHFADGPDSDERSFARIAAHAADCTLIEHRQPTEIDLREALHGIRLERSPGLRMPQIDRIEPDAALRVNAQAIFNGHGGDELFCRHHTHFYVADFLRDRGPRPGLVPLLLHSSVTEGETLWTILAGALRDAYVPHRFNMAKIFSSDQQNQSLLHPDIRNKVPEDHRLEDSTEQSTRACPPGKLWQINLLAGRRFHRLPSTRDGDACQVSPLLSQPLMETCLRIPSWLQMKDRRERAVARAAFTREVPAEILNRRWKGGAEHLAWRIVHRNLPFIREVLLDGYLNRAHMLDRPRLEALFDASPAAIVKATVPVFQLVGVEAWLQAWAGRGVPELR